MTTSDLVRFLRHLELLKCFELLEKLWYQDFMISFLPLHFKTQRGKELKKLWIHSLWGALGCTPAESGVKKERRKKETPTEQYWPLSKFPFSF